MTYNFDPDLWYENHLAILEERRERGELDDAGFEAAVEALDRELDAMVARLDGTYELPPAPKR